MIREYVVTWHGVRLHVEAIVEPDRVQVFSARAAGERDSRTYHKGVAQEGAQVRAFSSWPEADRLELYSMLQKAPEVPR